MDPKKIEALVRRTGSNPDMSIKAARELRGALGDRVASILLETYRDSRIWRQRAWCVYLSIPYARSNRDAFTLGIEALADNSRIVRYRACMLLAYSLNDDALPFLKALLAHKDTNTAEHAKAAVDAIVHKNHNYFVDRDHSGRLTLSIPESYHRRNEIASTSE